MAVTHRRSVPYRLSRRKMRTGPRTRPAFATMTPYMLRVYEVLADGLVHDEEEVIRACSVVIPPSVAWRHTMAQFKAQGVTPSGSVESQVRSGRRRMLMQAMGRLSRTGNAVRKNGTIVLVSDAVAEYQAWK